MINNNLSIKDIYLVYTFLTNLDFETKTYYHDSFIFPIYKSLPSFLCYIRLFISSIFPGYILIKLFPRLVYKTKIFFIGNHVKAFAYLTFRELKSRNYESTLGIIVGKPLRSKGIGNLLLKSLIKEAKNINVIRIILLVSNQNHSAITLYKRNGFKIIRKTLDFYNKKEQEALVMELRFK